MFAVIIDNPVGFDPLATSVLIGINLSLLNLLTLPLLVGVAPPFVMVF
jgi:hypothetical protein